MLARTGLSLREALAGLGLVTLVRRCAELPDIPTQEIEGVAVLVLRTLAGRIQTLDAEIRVHQQHLTTIIGTCAPGLLARHGIGPDTAAALLITAGDNPDRLTDEAAFTAPSAALARSRHPPAKPPATDSTAAATAEPTPCRSAWAATNAPATTPTAAPRRKVQKDIIRCLKRYVAREIFSHHHPRPHTTHNPRDHLTNIGASSRSIRNSTFSARNRANSAHSSPVRRSTSPRLILSWLSQFPKVPGLIPKSAATRAIDFPVSQTIRTAP